MEASEEARPLLGDERRRPRARALAAGGLATVAVLATAAAALPRAAAPPAALARDAERAAAANATRAGARALPYLSGLRARANASDSPHVLLLLVDDMGANDVGYASTDLAFATPSMDALAADGVRLARYYTLPSCTPARAALLTGRYASSVGMGYDAIGSFWLPSSYGLPLAHTLLPQALRAVTASMRAKVSASETERP